MPASSYLIVGGGVFGASTAYHLAKAHPQAKISLVDRTSFPNPRAASYDFDKVVRADYGDRFYCDLALKAIAIWRTDPLYKAFYHQSGLVNIDDTGLGKQIIKNYEALKVPCESVLIKPGELKTRYGGAFATSDYVDVDDIFVNPLSGWAEATLALTKVIEAALALGVDYIEGDIETLVLDSEGTCTGVRTADGRVISASKTILCTGAATAKLLADSAPEWKELHAGERITAAAVVTAIVKLKPEEVAKFKDVPVFVHSVGITKGETMPPTPDGLLKFCRDVSFKNTIKHEKSGTLISIPPSAADYAQHVVPNSLKEECLTVIKGIYGKEAENWTFDSFRICWDGFTPNQDFIISSHPHSANLTIATAGSFHGWKFLPIIGDYVVQLLDNKLEESLLKRWAWDREGGGAARGTLQPHRELKDL